VAQLYHASSPEPRRSTRWALLGAWREWLRTCGSSPGVSNPSRSRYSAQKAKDSSTCDGASRITSLLPPPRNRSAGPAFLTSESVVEGSQATIDYTAGTHFIGTVMSEPQSVTQWLQGARAGQDDAFQRLWERYYEQLVALARRRQGHTPRRMPAENPLVAAK